MAVGIYSEHTSHHASNCGKGTPELFGRGSLIARIFSGTEGCSEESIPYHKQPISFHVSQLFVYMKLILDFCTDINEIILFV